MSDPRWRTNALRICSLPLFGAAVVVAIVVQVWFAVAGFALVTVVWITMILIDVDVYPQEHTEMTFPFRPRWMLVVVGDESGTETPMPFMRYWRRASAEVHAERMNTNRDLTRIEIRPWRKMR